jgi:hypothetical protein
MVSLIMANNKKRAAETAENTLNYFQSVRLFLRAAALRSKLGEPQRELEILEQGLSRFPASPELAAAMKSVDGEVSGIEVQASQSIAL